MSLDPSFDTNGLEPQGLTWEHLQGLLKNLSSEGRCSIEFVYRRPSRELSTSYFDLERMIQEMLGRLGVGCRFQVDAYSEGSDSMTGRVRVRFMCGPRPENRRQTCDVCGHTMVHGGIGFKCLNCGNEVVPK